MTSFESRGRTPARIAALLLAAAGAACTAGPPELQLAENLDLAFFQPETRIVDFGTPEARQVMDVGWHTLDERWLGERTFVWGRGAASRLRFQVFNPGSRMVRFVGRPNPSVGPEGLPVAVVLNGELLTTVTLLPGWLEYRVRLPAARLTSGANHLEFHYRGAASEVNDGSLQVAWDSLRMGRPFEYGPPGVEPGAESLALRVPFFSELEYFFPAAPDSVLEFGPIEPYGEQIQTREAYLEASIQVEGQLEAIVHRVSAEEFGRVHRIPLGVDGTAPVSVSLRALPGYEPGRESGLTLQAPRLTGGGYREEAAESRAAAVPARQPNVIVYMVDTLRADHLGIYGYPLPTSPELDAFGADAVVFDRAFTQSGWTRTSVASLFTGLLPTAHGINGRDDALDPGAPTIATSLRELGYTTVGWTTNGNVSEQFGFGAGFDSYVHLRERHTPEIHVLAHEVNDEFFGWLDEAPAEQPFFAYLHVSDPHDPYMPLPEFAALFPSPGDTGIVQPRAIAAAQADDPDLTDERLLGDLVARYDAEIAQTDHAFGALLDGLRERSRYDDTVVVFLADHGEEFLDHGRWAHGKTLYREMIGMPLVIRVPGWPAGRTTTPAQHVDLLPTLVTLGGGEAPESTDGHDLTPWLHDPATAPGSARVRSYLDLDGYSLASLVTGDFHLIRPGMTAPGVSLGGVMMFDLGEDPLERRDLRPLDRLRAGILATRQRMLERGESLLYEPGAAEIDDELRDRLRALGYIQ